MFRRLAAFLAAACVAFLAGGSVFAQTGADVGFVGLVSPDLGAAELAQVESGVEQMLARQARVRGKNAMLESLTASEGVAASLASARGAAEAGAKSLDAFNLPKALEELGRALQLYESSYGSRLAPAEVARVLERRAQAAYALRRPAEMRRDFARAVFVQPAKGLDERVFAPDAVAAFEEEAARVRAGDPLAPPVDDLAEIARLGGVRWALSGEVRAAEGGAVDLHLTLVSRTGTFLYRHLRAPRDGAGVERGLASMLEATGVPKPEVVAVATPAPTPIAVKPPPRDDRRRVAAAPVYKRWYFWGGVVLAGAAAAYATSSELGRDSGENDPGGPGDPGVTIQFEDR